LAVVVVAGIIASLGLVGCGSSSLAYSDGYSVGQSMASNAAGLTTAHAVIVATCRHQWRLSGSSVDPEQPWVGGCVRGFSLVQATLGTTHP
jgi:hypothetical protein